MDKRFSRFSGSVRTVRRSLTKVLDWLNQTSSSKMRSSGVQFLSFSSIAFLVTVRCSKCSDRKVRTANTKNLKNSEQRTVIFSRTVRTANSANTPNCANTPNNEQFEHPEQSEQLGPSKISQIYGIHLQLGLYNIYYIFFILYNRNYIVLCYIIQNNLYCSIELRVLTIRSRQKVLTESKRSSN